MSTHVVIRSLAFSRFVEKHTGSDQQQPKCTRLLRCLLSHRVKLKLIRLKLRASFCRSVTELI